MKHSFKRINQVSSGTMIGCYDHSQNNSEHLFFFSICPSAICHLKSGSNKYGLNVQNPSTEMDGKTTNIYIINVKATKNHQVVAFLSQGNTWTFKIKFIGLPIQWIKHASFRPALFCLQPTLQFCRSTDWLPFFRVAVIDRTMLLNQTRNFRVQLRLLRTSILLIVSQARSLDHISGVFWGFWLDQFSPKKKNWKSSVRPKVLAAV